MLINTHASKYSLYDQQRVKWIMTPRFNGENNEDVALFTENFQVCCRDDEVDVPKRFDMLRIYLRREAKIWFISQGNWTAVFVLMNYIQFWLHFWSG